MGDTEKILAAIHCLKNSVNDNSKKIDEMKNIVFETNTKLQLIEKELESVKKENEQLKLVNQHQNEKIVHLETEVRSKNLILYGFNFECENRADCLQELVSFLTTKLAIECDVNDIVYFRKLGRRTANIPILIKFDSEKKKRDIISKRMLLKGTNYFLNEDFPKEIREERKILYTWVKQEAEKGNIAKLRYNFVLLNGKKIFVQDIINQVPASSKKNVRRRESDTENKVSFEELAPVTPNTVRGTQLEQWLNTPDRKKAQRILKKPKFTGSSASCPS